MLRARRICRKGIQPLRRSRNYQAFIDSLGCASDATEALYKLGCNIADSSCAMLAGEFAMILIVSHPRPFSKSRLFEELKPACDRLGMFLAVSPLTMADVPTRENEQEICLVSVYGADQPGIVFRVTRELACQGINITDLTTKLIGTKEEPVYVMMLEAALPDGQTPQQLEKLLENLKKELDVEIGVRVVTPVSL